VARRQAGLLSCEIWQAECARQTSAAEGTGKCHVLMLQTRQERGLRKQSINAAATLYRAVAHARTRTHARTRAFPSLQPPKGRELFAPRTHDPSQQERAVELHHRRTQRLWCCNLWRVRTWALVQLRLHAPARGRGAASSTFLRGVC
jgi:hypothetical protein